MRKPPLAPPLSRHFQRMIGYFLPDVTVQQLLIGGANDDLSTRRKSSVPRDWTAAGARRRYGDGADGGGAYRPFAGGSLLHSLV